MARTKKNPGEAQKDGKIRIEDIKQQIFEYFIKPENKILIYGDGWRALDWGKPSRGDAIKESRERFKKAISREEYVEILSQALEARRAGYIPDLLEIDQVVLTKAKGGDLKAVEIAYNRFDPQRMSEIKLGIGGAGARPGQLGGVNVNFTIITNIPKPLQIPENTKPNERGVLEVGAWSEAVLDVTPVRGKDEVKEADKGD